MESDHRIVSEYTLEVICTRLDRINKRLIIALVLTIIFAFASNGAWLWAWMQYDYESEITETTYSQDGQGTNIIGDRNEVRQYVPDFESDYENPETEEKEQPWNKET